MGTVDVDSPVVMSINPGGSKTELGNAEVTLDATTGLSTITFTTVAKNNANNLVSGYRVIVVEAPDNEILTGKEFTEVLFKDANNDGPPFDILTRLRAVGSDGALYKLADMSADFWPHRKMILLFKHPDGRTQFSLAVDEVNWNNYEITLENIEGKYGISTQYVYDLAGYAAEQYGH